MFGRQRGFRDTRRLLPYVNAVSNAVVTENLVASYQWENNPDFANVTDDILDSWGVNNGFVSPPYPTTDVDGIVNKTWLLTGNGVMDIRDDYETNFRLNDGTINKSFAFSFWVNLSAVQNMWFFSKRGSSGSQAEYQFVLYQGNLILTIWNTDGTTTAIKVNNHSFDVSRWYHLSGYVDLVSQTGKIFQDNVEITNEVVWNPKTFKTTTYRLSLGHSGFNSSAFFVRGKLDEMRFWIGDEVPTNFSNEYNDGLGITL